MHLWGMRLLWKYIRNYFLAYHLISNFFVISPKLQRIWSWNLGFAIRKIWIFIWYQKIYYFWWSPGGWECNQQLGPLRNIKSYSTPAEILMHQVHKPEGWVHWTSIKIEAQVHYFVTIIEQFSNSYTTWPNFFAFHYVIKLHFSKFEDIKILPTKYNYPCRQDKRGSSRMSLILIEL